MTPLATSKSEKLESFVDILAKRGLIQPDDRAGLKEKYSTPEEAFESLLSKKIVSEEDLTRAYADLYKVLFVDLKNIKPSVLKTVPQNLAQKYQIVPFDFKDRTLWIGIALPHRLRQGNLGVLKQIEERSGVKIGIGFTTQKAVEEVFQREEILKVELPEVVLAGKYIPRQVLEKVPKVVAERYQFVVFDAPAPNYIKVATVNPTDPKLRGILAFIREKNQIRVDEYQTSKADFDWAIRLYEWSPPAPPVKKATTERAKQPSSQSKQVQVEPTLPISKSSTRSLGAKKDELKTQPKALTALPPTKPEQEETKPTLEEVWEESDLDKFLGRKITTLQELKAVIKENSVPKLVAALIGLAAYLEASDIHIEGIENEVRVRYRVDGVLRDILKLPIRLFSSIVARIKILSKLKIDEKRIPQDGRFDVKTGGHAIDLRVSTLPTVFGEKVAMRLLDKDAGILSLENLGMIGVGFDRVVVSIEKPFGVILACGPTGSGKSTTLYAILRRIASPKVNVVTLEDPVEYEIPGLNQVQVKPQIGFTFATGLRSVLRQDPNIIMVGEVRDTETANLVTHAALTGHLVLTTLHTNDAAGALPRLVNMGVEPFLITSSINCIIAQRLVRKLCPHCRVPAQIPEATLFSIKKELDKINITEPLKFYRGKGCSKCSEGYRGRIGLYEVLLMSDEIEALTVNRSPANVIYEKAVKEGMITMTQDGLIKALKGITTVDEVYRATAE